MTAASYGAVVSVEVCAKSIAVARHRSGDIPFNYCESSFPPFTMKQELPKQYEHIAAQKRWYSYWEEKGFFQSDPNPEKSPYTIVIPPPNVTGALHLGHALNDTLQDIMIRLKRMQGFQTLWLPGMDHAGIATQAVVERRLREEEGKTRHDLGREGLVARIWDWKEDYQKRITAQIKQMGCSCDWRRTRFTLDDICARAVRHTFFKMFQEKLIYRGKRLVNWDTHLQTAVSDDEVFHETIPGNFWYFRYPVLEPKTGEPEHVTIATTRPETMLGDTAVAVHPDPEKALDRAEDELKDKLQTAPKKHHEEIEADLAALAERRKTMLPRLITLRDMALDGRKLNLPLLDREIPLVADTWAKPELGTGCVKVTPAHDPNDYDVGRRLDLPMVNILNKDGTLNENAGPYQGLAIPNARKKVVDDLEKLSLLEKVEDRIIELAHSDRSKTPIEPYLNDQWFVRMDHLAQTAMDAVDDGRVKIIPKRYTKSYLDWLSEKRDWPIGRQLWWGHRIPIWYCADADQAALEKAFAGRDDVVWHWDDEMQQWWICSREEDLAPDAVAGHQLVQEEDVLDTWFSSALWPHSTLGWPEETPELKYFYPTSVLITSRDIITLWVARMVLAGLFNVGEIPFHEVYIHPKILDKYGEGMSKSKGNGVDPISVMEKFGADSLRFALAYLTTESQDVRLGLDFQCPHCGETVEQTRKNRTLAKIGCPHCKKEFATQWAESAEDKKLPQAAVIGERFEVARNFCNKLWNASRFAMMHLEDFQPGEVREKDLLIEDRWILSRLATVARKVTEALDHYRFSEAARTLYDFAWDEFCSFYVEMIKNRLQTSDQRPQAQRILAHTLDVLLRLLHPIIPFLTEEVWQLLGPLTPVRGIPEPAPASEAVIIAPWPEPQAAAIDPVIESQFQLFQEVLRAVREIRSRQNVPPKTEICFSVRSDEETVRLLLPMERYFESMAGARATEWGPHVEPPAISSNVALGQMDVFVDLADLIDVEAEIKKKQNDLAKLEKLVAGKEKKLQNEKFLAKAPEQVVQKERDSLADLERQVEATREALAQLQSRGETK